MPHHEKIDYVEFPANDLAAVKAFYGSVFGWEFQDYGADYTAFSRQGLDGGFYAADLHSSAADGGALIVFYSDDLQATLDKVLAAGGSIARPIFSFPGGRRFHFLDPAGNELAVWSSAGL